MRIVILRIILITGSAILCSAFPQGRDIGSEEVDGRIAVNLGRQKYYQGDVNLKSPKNRNAVLEPKRWPNATIYYQVQPVFSQKYKNRIYEAMKAIEKNTCLRFVPRFDEKDYIYIFNGSGGCYSESVGRKGGRQKLSLMLGQKITCFTNAIITHELFHAIGLWHEQMRYDRDEHITIHWENVLDELRGQFEMVEEDESSTYGLNYDYTSIMHYDAYAFSVGKGNITMEPRDPSMLNVIGKAKIPSEVDWAKVRKVYECAGAAPLQNLPPPDSYVLKFGNKESEKPEPCVDKDSECVHLQRQCEEEDARVKCRKTCGQCEKT